MVIYLLLVAIILLDGLLHVLFRLLGKNEKGEFGSFSCQIFAALILLPFLGTFPPFSFLWFYPILAGCLYGIGTIFLFQAYSLGEVSLLAPLGHLSPLFIFVLAVIFLDESIGVFKIAAIGLLIFGLANLKKEESLFLSLRAVVKDKACQLYFLFVFFFSIARIVDKRASLFFSTTSYAFLEFLLPSLVALFYIFFKRELKELGYFLGRKVSLVVLLGLVTVFRYTSFLKAISFAEVGWVSAIISMGTITALLLSKLILKEKIKSRWLAAVLMIIGAVVLLIEV